MVVDGTQLYFNILLNSVIFIYFVLGIANVLYLLLGHSLPVTNNKHFQRSNLNLLNLLPSLICISRSSTLFPIF